jgi:hypothetical protein
MDERSFRVAFIHAKEASRAFVCLDESRALRSSRLSQSTAIHPRQSALVVRRLLSALRERWTGLV